MLQAAMISNSEEKTTFFSYQFPAASYRFLAIILFDPVRVFVIINPEPRVAAYGLTRGYRYLSPTGLCQKWVRLVISVFSPQSPDFRFQISDLLSLR